MVSVVYCYINIKVMVARTQTYELTVGARIGRLVSAGLTRKWDAGEEVGGEGQARVDEGSGNRCEYGGGQVMWEGGKVRGHLVDGWEKATKGNRERGWRGGTERQTVTTTIRWIQLRFSTHVHSAQTMNPTDFSSSATKKLTFGGFELKVSTNDTLSGPN